MPAILENDAGSAWLGEGGATPAVPKTMEGVNWRAAPEPKAPRMVLPDRIEWPEQASKVAINQSSS